MGHYSRHLTGDVQDQLNSGSRVTPGWLTRLSAAALRACEAIQRQQRLARDVAHLENMDDRELQDIGIHRWQIVDYVRGDVPYCDNRDFLQDAEAKLGDRRVGKTF